MTVDFALSEFENYPQMQNKLKLLQEVGLGYVRIGQPATTLSGGEAQRVKLSKSCRAAQQGGRSTCWMNLRSVSTPRMCIS
ncbi:MAG: hypothetical protein U0V48_08585 [Anaerolineales bacterium]